MKRGDHKKHFKHIIQGGTRLQNWSKSSSKIRTTEPPPKITGSNKKSVSQPMLFVRKKILNRNFKCFSVTLM